jgi:hypothetical protein
LMFLASSSRIPAAPVFEIFSLPARSTRNIRLFFVRPASTTEMMLEHCGTILTDKACILVMSCCNDGD